MRKQLKKAILLVVVLAAFQSNNYCVPINVGSTVGEVNNKNLFLTADTVIDSGNSQFGKIEIEKKQLSQIDLGLNLAPTPPMGWNSWNYFGKKNINEKIVREVIDAMVNQGLSDAGYKYVVIDGGWRDTILNPDGGLRPNPVRFPHGIKVLSDYAHSKGLRLGLHIVPGTADCGGDKVGGYGKESTQFRQFVDWGIDFLKLDKCRMEGGWNELLLRNVYSKWKKLIDSSGRKIVLSISAYKFRDWNPELGQLSRTTEDISAKVNGAAFFDTLNLRRNFDYLSVMEIAELNNREASHAGNGYWNDPDMLPLGAQGLSVSEQESAFALWCIMSSPLMLGNDPRFMSPSEKDIILNRVAIRINQDSTEQGRRLIKSGYCEIWGKHLNDGKLAVLMLNRNRYYSEQMDISFKELRLNDKVGVKDVFRDVSLGDFEHHFNREIEPNSSMFLLIENLEESSK